MHFSNEIQIPTQVVLLLRGWLPPQSDARNSLAATVNDVRLCSVKTLWSSLEELERIG